jgi:K+-sensing histidine kinase KdpD
MSNQNPNRLLESVHTVTQKLSSVTTLDEALRLTLEAAVEAVDASGGSILLHDPAAKQLWFRHVMGTDEQGRATSEGFGLYGVAIGDSEGIAGQVFQTQTPQITNDASQNPQHAKRIDTEFQYETRNLVTVPIRYPGGMPLGVIQLVNKRDGDFTEEDLTVLDIVASISAMSAQNAELAQQARKSAALDYLGRVIYDIRNRLAHMGAQIEALREKSQAPSEPAEMRTLIQTVAEDGANLRRYLEFMADIVAGKPIAPRLEEHDLVEVTERQVALLEPEARRERGILILRDYELGQPIQGQFDSFLLERAVFNLIQIALNSAPDGGTVTVRVASNEEEAMVEARDAGPGLSPYLLAQILSGAASGAHPGSTGLSATIAREIIETHGGRFEGENVEGVGSIFRLRLPLTHPATEEGTSE